ncbi:hypothetical protein GJAV_G00202820 [Gymnothorax javanicus]|nr:hypothetical protein GJAV_G00202820 [Gymnothorax javanicus]
MHQQQDFPTVDKHQPQDFATLNRYHSVDYPNPDRHQLLDSDKPALQQHEVQDLPGLPALQNELQKIPPHVFQNLLQNLGYRLAVQKNPQQDLEDILEISLKPQQQSLPNISTLGHKLQDAQDTSEQKHQSCNIPDQVLQRSQLQHLKVKQAEFRCQQEGQRYQPAPQENQQQLILNAPALKTHLQQGLLNAEASHGHRLQDFSGLALQNNPAQDVHPKHHIESPKRTQTTEVIGEGHPVPGSLAMEPVRTASPIPSLALSPDITGLRSNFGLQYQITSQPSVNRGHPVPGTLAMESVRTASPIPSLPLSPDITGLRSNSGLQYQITSQPSVDRGLALSPDITGLRSNFGLQYQITSQPSVNRGHAVPGSLAMESVRTASPIPGLALSPDITGLRSNSGLQYQITSQPSVNIVIPVPEQLTVSSVTATSAILSWQVSPMMQQTPHRFQVSYQGAWMEPKSIIAESCSTTITDLKPGTEYNVMVATQLQHGGTSQPATVLMQTEIPSPERLTVSSVTVTSAILSWQVSPEMHQIPHRFQVSYQSAWMEPKSIIAQSCSTTITDLKPGTEYTVTVSTQLKHGGKSQPATVKMTTATPVPEQLTVSSVTTTSASLHWLLSAEMPQTPHSFIVSYQSEGTESQSIIAETCSATITGLKLGTEYTVTVSTQLKHGGTSHPATVNLKTEIPAPQLLTVSSVTATSAILSWQASPEMHQTPHWFQVSYQSELMEPKSIIAQSCSTTITDLKPGTKYNVTVSTQLQHGGKSQPATVKMATEIPAPQLLTVSTVTATSAILSWQASPEMHQTPHWFQVSYQSELMEPKSIIAESCSTTIIGLKPGTEYSVTVSTQIRHGGKSQPATVKMTTEMPAPQLLTVSSVTATSAILSWQVSPEMHQTPHRFQVSYQSELMEPKSIIAESCSTTITDLKPGTEYSVTVSTQLNHGGKSQPACFNVKTEPGLADLLSTLGLRDLHGGKLTLSRVLEINSNTVTDKPAESLEHLPWIFLKKLMTSNLNSRNVKCVSQNFDEGNSPFDDFHADSINPLDVITAVLHCADPFLQQEMVSKMAMCQFAVPLLMPNIDTRQSTLMLWALRDIVKKYRHLSSADAKTFVEGRIVQIDMPVISFVRLGQCSLSKSLTLNKLLSNPHQHNETFVHYDMEGGDVPRKIDDGLVEISWYLPCGNNNIDMFTQPVAIANLRGDARTLEAQMSFLLQISTAVFIFCDDLESDLSILTSREIKAKLFLVINSQSETFNKEILSATCRKHNFAVNNVIVKKKQSDADFVRVLRSNVTEAIEKNPMKTTIEDMAAVASQVGILVDEHDDECAKGKCIAEDITRDITDVVRFKENQLPLHGKTWKEISQLEKERCRMKKAGKDIEQYRCSLQKKEKELRKIQKQKSMSDAMEKFITGISKSRTERLYFLKWLKIQLDNCSRQNLSSLREKYKECCQSTPGKKEQIKHLDEQISNCSLGPEHFFRELGQIYEAASSPPLNDPARQQYQDLPKLCAQMLLDGFPIELVDGDASNIPLKWISEVLTQLHVKVENNSRILVLTVLGVQSTGKSTLLNTMFGVQFAVSSGRCTRGAFMLLTKVSEEYKPQLKCDFIMIIDTEGLKSPELAALDTSYEHDNELATLVIGLSDVTIINIAMENSTEMKDILQIAVHAFLRMKEVGKKPRCLFVHQNVSDMAAHDSNLRDRKKLVEQLDEMTRAAARMEKKEAHTKFTDVMEYDPDRNTHYIPGLWHGTPPMAPVNAGYSEAVTTITDLKPGTEYTVTVSTQLKHGGKSQPITVQMTAEIPAPEQLTVSSVTATSAILSWQASPEMHQTPHWFQVSYQSELMEPKSIITESCSTTITDLKPGTEYNVTVSTQIQHGGKSQPATVKMTTEIPAPEQLTVSSVTATSAILSWQVSPMMQQTPHRFQVSYQGEWTEPKSIIAESCSTTITDLKPGTEYTVTVSTQLKHGGKSQPITVQMTAEIPAPQQLTVSSVTATSAFLSWQVSPMMHQTPHRFQVSYQSELMEPKSIITESCSTTITGLKPGTEYNVTVSTQLQHGGKSQPATVKMTTEIPAPEQLTVSSVTATSTILSWQVSPEMHQTPHWFQVSYQGEWMEPKSIIAESCSTPITDLKPGTEYTVTVSTQIRHGGKSQPAYFNVKTGTTSHAAIVFKHKVASW